MSAFVVRSNFYCIFKTGDNVNYNLLILRYFYSLYDNEANTEEKKLLIKPIVIWLMSISEAVLHDFHKRVRVNRIEGVVNMSEDVVDYIRDKKLDELKKYIVSARKHDLFDLKDTKFYAKLDELRLIRNRIHIQNEKFLDPLDERFIFSEDVKKLAEMCTEIVVKTMSRKYPRPESLSSYVSDMYFPWEEHFPEANYGVH